MKQKRKGLRPSQLEGEHQVVCNRKVAFTQNADNTTKTISHIDRRNADRSLRVGGETLPQVEELKHLGVLFTSEGKMECEESQEL